MPNALHLYYTGRRRPYTADGVKRLRCIRCGETAAHTWSACANGNRHVPLCLRCDIALNEVVLRFMRLPYAETLLQAYRRKVLGT